MLIIVIPSTKYNNIIGKITQVRIRAFDVFPTMIWVIILSVKDATAERFRQICKERRITINELANISGVTPSTAYSMLDEKRRDISLITVKKFCDGLDMTLGEFFSCKEFDLLEQEIK